MYQVIKKMAMPELSRIDASMVALPLVSTVISVVFLIALPFRLYALYQSNVKVKATWIAPIKSVGAVELISLQ